MVEPHEVTFAVEVARDAGAVTKQWFGAADLDIEHKQDGSPVTEADREAELLIRERIEGRFPDDAIVGEEFADRPGTSGRTWVLDPIDGTKSFTHGVPLFATLIALIDEQGPAIGVIDLPVLGETVWAGRGLGCHHNGNPASVAGCDAIQGSWLMTSGLRVWRGAAIDRLVAAGVHIRTWADAYGYFLVATGQVDAMVDPVANVWDLAAPAVIVAEAGGTFTDLEGRFRADGGSGVATAGTIHDDLLRLLDGCVR
ncbi:MAG: histidinol phosphate phosphatase [Acidimicrobiia bacterium]|nr:histidinol phosphate phosphatase [Acidimicrobiia bacterium]